MKERLKNHQLQELATQNNTDARVEKAIQQGSEQPQIQKMASSSGNARYVEGGSISSGLIRNAAGGLVGAVGSAVRGIGGLFSGNAIEEQYHTPGGHRKAPIPIHVLLRQANMMIQLLKMK